MSLVAAVASPGARAQTDDAAVEPPDVFAGSASAAVASVEFEPEGLLPVSDLFRFILLDGEASYETSNQEARASLVFPGNGAILGPSLICTFAPFPPELQFFCGVKYPLTVFADGLNPEQATDGSIRVGAPTDPVNISAASARARAADDGATTDAEVSDVRVLGIPAVGGLPVEGLDVSVLRIDEASARTHQFIDGDGALVVESTATLSGVTIGAGVVHIGSLVSVARLVDPPDGDPAPETSIEVGGVTVAGVPASITEDGLVLGAPQSQSPAVLDQLDQLAANALAALGMRVTLLPEEAEVTPGGSSSALVGGLLIELTVPVSGLPPVPTPIPGFAELDLNGTYTGSIQLGRVGASSVASTFPDRRPARPSTTPGPPAGGSTGSAGPATGSATGAPAPAAPAAPLEPAAPEAPEAPEAIPIVDDLLSDRIALLYLSFTLAALACCVAPGLTAPARLPGPRRA